MPPILRGGSAKPQLNNTDAAQDDGDIPRAVPPKKPEQEQ